MTNPYPNKEYPSPIATSIHIDVHEDRFWELYINGEMVEPLSFSLNATQFDPDKEPHPLLTYRMTVDPSIGLISH